MKYGRNLRVLNIFSAFFWTFLKDSESFWKLSKLFEVLLTLFVDSEDKNHKYCGNCSTVQVERNGGFWPVSGSFAILRGKN